MRHIHLFLLMVLFLAGCTPLMTTTPTLTPTPTQTFTPDPTATKTPSPTPTITPVPTQIGGGSGRFIFVFAKQEYIKMFPDLQGESNVFLAKINGSYITPITNGLDGYIFLQGISPDGTKVLITSTSRWKNTDSNLYLLDLNSLDTEPVKLAHGLPNFYGKGSPAKWIDDTKIIYTGQGEKGFGIYIINVDGTNAINIERNIPFEILGVSSTRVYWDTQIVKRLSYNSVSTANRVWWTSLDGTEGGQVNYNGKQLPFSYFYGHSVAFSPDGTKIAWVEPATRASEPPYQSYLHIALISDINNPSTFEILSAKLALQWWPDGSKILVFDQSPLKWLGQHSKYNNGLYGIYEISSPPDPIIKNYYVPRDFLDSIRFNLEGHNISPDGRLITFYTYSKQDGGKLIIINSETTEYFTANKLNFFSNIPHNLQWLP